MPDPTDTVTEPAADDRIPPPEPLRQRAWDAITWALSLVISNLANVGHTWRNASERERFRLLASLLRTAVVVFLCVDLGIAWLWLWAVLCIADNLADLDDVAAIVAERKKTLRLLESTPTGAPRVANIRCGRDVTHRFIYGPGGWEEAGPAQHPADA